jgi:hypothetical protein
LATTEPLLIEEGLGSRVGRSSATSLHIEVLSGSTEHLPITEGPDKRGFVEPVRKRPG